MGSKNIPINGQEGIWDLSKVLAQKHALYQSSLVCHLKGLFESGPSEMDLSIEVRRFRESSAEWGEILKIEKDLGRTVRTWVSGDVGAMPDRS